MSATSMRNAPTGHVMTFLSRHHRCWVNKKEFLSGAVLTHTFLDKTWTGKIFIPPELDDEFQAAVARDVEAGTLPPLNELRANSAGVFRFFVDVDLHLPPGDDAAALTAAAVGACAAREVKRFLCRSSAENMRCLVLTTPDVPADTEGGRAKRGIHLHFPLVRVGTHEALLMREALIVALARDVSDKVDWAEDLDNTPYVNATGGLRMLGAPKAITCGECRDVAAERKTCNACRGTGRKLLPDRKYALSTVLDGDGNVDEETLGFLRTNPVARSRAASVRTSRTTVMSDWKCFEGCPSYSALKTRPNAPPKPGNKRRVFSEESRSLQKWPKVEVLDADKRKCLLDIFRKRFEHIGGGVYKRVDLSTIKFSARANAYYAQFSGEGESFCLNVGRSHRSNRVYGVVDYHSAYIRCHCSCATTEQRVSGKMCREFRSPPVTLTRHDSAVLFGNDRGAPSKGAASVVSGEEYLANLSRTLYQMNEVASQQDGGA